ncbi:hypothetical protein EKK58_04270 [Candidatus Dependentiae bacterium]|nr:MAG: hypothetical protein EKK58_04270 [Candidatus Dependentiae bacterium]
MPRSNLITRTGSKQTDIKFFKHLLPMDVKNVVEPFGGSFAVIRDVYADKKYKKFVNDLDPNLYYVYKHPEELVEAYKKWNEINDDLKIKTSKEKKEKLKELNINDYLKQYIMDTQITRGVITKSKNIDDVKPDLDFIKKIDFSHEDAFEFMKPFLSKKDTFIFLDPPYLFSNNETYFPQNKEEGDMDMTDYYIKFIDILKDKKTKAKIMLVINDLKILRWLYKDFVKGDYMRIYQASKKKSKHLIITNY